MRWTSPCAGCGKEIELESEDVITRVSKTPSDGSAISVVYANFCGVFCPKLGATNQKPSDC